MAPVYCPEPLSVILEASPVTLSVTVIDALWEPVVVGENATLMVQLEPPASAVPQVLV